MEFNEAKERAKRIKAFIHDIHGALTPNIVYCDIEGRRRYPFWHMDGFGDLSLFANGITVIYLDSSSIDEEGLFRAKELKLEKYYYRIPDETSEKLKKLEEIKKEFSLSDDEIGFLGSEITDIPIMKRVGFAVATKDAEEEVKKIAHYVTEAQGGRGAMREVCEFILRSMGKWEEWVDKVTKMGYK